MNHISKDGTTMQSMNRLNLDDYPQHTCPVLGIVLRTFYSDHPQNRTSINKSDQRGSACLAEVLVINDGTNNPWLLSNVMVLPHGASGVDNYHEELPKPASGLVDGASYSGNLAAVNLEKLDGDYAVIQFIGGSIQKPIMTHWFPHPSNRRDPATAGFAQDTLIQSRRLFKRYQGAKIVVTTDGSLYLDTSESGSLLKGPNRILNDQSGGDIKITVKSTKSFEINFNKPVPDPAVPSLPQLNPPQGAQVREDTLSRITADKEMIQAMAGAIIQIYGKQAFDSVLLGEFADFHALLGERVQATFNALVDAFNALKAAFEAHIHIDGHGLTTSTQSGTPTVPTALFAAAELTTPPPPHPSPTIPKYDPIPVSGTVSGEYMPDTDLSIIVKLE
jgi:hypothetical protein